MKSIKLTAFAKANLSLNITGKIEGMHVLDSVMVSLDAFDEVIVTERDDSDINVTFLNADIPCTDNTAYKAAAAVRELTGRGCDIRIEKGIPTGAGLGGSSADGAAVLRALDIFYRIPSLGADMRKIALSVGSDVPFMLTGGTARVRGTGDDLFFIKNKLPLFAVGLMDGGVSTAAAYKAFDDMHDTFAYAPTDNAALAELLMSGDERAIEIIDNALYAPAVSLVPSVAENAKILKATGAAANMTGSGGMVLGWFTDISAFALCASALKDRAGFRVFAPVATGILHEWIQK